MNEATRRNQPSVLIRRAAEEDASGIAEVHYAAVHKTAARHYTADILDQWSPTLTDGRMQQFRRVIAEDKEWMVVAVLDSRIVGFGSIIPADEKLAAVYVHPDFGRRGIGRQILDALERQAERLGLERLRLNASVNAESFYRAAGYQVRDRGVHRLRGGGTMACIEMVKELPRRRA